MPERLAKRVLLIGWDAADWQLIDPMLKAGQMPALAAFLAGGVRANIQTLNPIISPILWSSIATGKHADKHDIFGFMEPNGKGGLRPVSSTSRRAKAMWNILSQHGLRSTVIGWFASCPAEQIHGVVVGDRYRQAATQDPETFVLDERSIWPRRVLEDLAELIVEPADIAGETAAFFAPRIGEVDAASSPYPAALSQLIAEASTVHNAATRLLETEPFDLMAVYYDSIDHFGHGFMEFHPPAMDHTRPEDAAIFGGVMNAAYRYHDLMLARLLALAGPDTTVILISDHGFHSGGQRPRILIDPQTGQKRGAGLNPVAWHRPVGVFAARGPGIKQGAEINGVTLLDLCPTVLTLLGIPVGEDMDGHVIEHMFESPPRIARVATHEDPHPGDGVWRGEVVEDPYAAQQTLKQLADLGYIEGLSDSDEANMALILRDRRSNMAQAKIARGQFKEAEGLLRELVAEHPAAAYRSRLAICLVEQERFAEAEPILKELAGDPQEAPVATLLLAQIQFGMGRYDEAAEIVQRVVDFGVRIPQLHTQLGHARFRQGRWAEAETAYRAAIDLSPDDVDANDGLGSVLLNQGKADDAVYHHMRAIALDPSRALAHLNLGVALISVGQIDWAVRALEKAAELAPAAPLPHRYLADIYRVHKPDEAAFARHKSKALELKAKAAKEVSAAILARDHW